MRLITLTTDFGLRDPYVGIMKGVLLGICPGAVIVDLTHDIPPGNVRAGALALAAAVPFFPPNSIHVVVVDPGVGSDRRAVAVRTSRAKFVGPDNGVLSLALVGQSGLQIRQITNTRWMLKPVSRTFHGRDVFAPMAARLAAGMPFARVGPPLRQIRQIDWPEPVSSGQRIQGEVIHVDRFGNLVTNLDAERLSAGAGRHPVVWIRRQLIGPLRGCYADAAPGEPLALVGSTGRLEISVNGGDASARFRAQIGEPVDVRWNVRSMRSRAG